MKHFVVYSGLFLLFATSIGATKFLDSYSSQYVNCAQKWKSTVASAQGKPALASRLIEMLDENTLTANGQTCPELREGHINTLKTDLEGFLRR